MDHRDLFMKKSTRVYSIEEIILFENEEIIAINKPSGISSLAERDATRLSIHEMAVRYVPTAILCHRLDKFTSGVMLIAKHEAAYRNITLKFQKREVKKYYLTLIEGQHSLKDQLMDYGIYSQNGKVRLDNANGKRAITIFNTREIFRHYTLLEASPITGRMHQIRLHLLAAGMPVVGDKLYNGKDVFLSFFKRNYKFDSMHDERPLNDGFLLHAAKIELALPGSETPAILEAPLSPGFNVVVKVLRKWDSG